MSNNYTCHVCDDPPERYEICPCCGTEFENDDEIYTHEELRNKWIRSGMHIRRLR